MTLVLTFKIFNSHRYAWDSTFTINGSKRSMDDFNAKEQKHAKNLGRNAGRAAYASVARLTSSESIDEILTSAKDVLIPAMMPKSFFDFADKMLTTIRSGFVRLSGHSIGHTNVVMCWTLARSTTSCALTCLGVRFESTCKTKCNPGCAGLYVSPTTRIRSLTLTTCSETKMLRMTAVKMATVKTKMARMISTSNQYERGCGKVYTCLIYYAYYIDLAHTHAFPSHTISARRDPIIEARVGCSTVRAKHGTCDKREAVGEDSNDVEDCELVEPDLSTSMFFSTSEDRFEHGLAGTCWNGSETRVSLRSLQLRFHAFHGRVVDNIRNSGQLCGGTVVICACWRFPGL